MLVFKERGKPEYPKKNLSEQSREPTKNSTHMWLRVRESNPGHIGGRQALSPLHHPCSPLGHCLQRGINFSEMPCLSCARQVVHVALSCTLMTNRGNETFRKSENWPDQWPNNEESVRIVRKTTHLWATVSRHGFCLRFKPEIWIKYWVELLKAAWVQCL